MRLTAEQQAIVDHTYGPARVFAVAGAGKTTAIVHRIHRLASEGIFVPDRILAASFSRASVQDLRTALCQWPECRSVKTQTLHALCYRVIRRAWQGYLPRPATAIEPSQVSGRLYHLALGRAREQQVDFQEQLEDIDQEDFLTYVSSCKGRLHYADLSQVSLPEAGPHRGIACQAQPPAERALDWYLDLYRLLEAIRHEQGWIGFDDMLMTAWQLLVCHADLRREFQSQFDCIIVDEFQDINRAQFAVLDLLSHRHRNYMVVGDDDQTIYEWRGAEVRFILDAFDRYRPTDYTIADNFRSQASQVAIANAVIGHNRNRRPKHLSLTQGFTGSTHLHRSDSDGALGAGVVEQVQQALETYPMAEIAILVRLYAQTPYIEQQLIEANIPYWGPDLVPFYDRRETLDFLAWAQLACLDAALKADVPLQKNDWLKWEAAWERVRRLPPIRYLGRQVKDRLYGFVISGGGTLQQALGQVQEVSARSAKGLLALAGWLEKEAGASAKEALLRLDWRLGYRDYLRRHSGLKQAGQGRALGIDALITYAEGKGDLPAFLEHLEDLRQRAEHHARSPHRCIWLTTIHQAKGLEWTVVMVPHCNQGVLPFGEAPAIAELEEERRLMYVALTRAKRDLHLFILRPQMTSQFLREAQAQAVLSGVNWLSRLLEKESETWTAQDAIAFLQAVKSFRLERYFHQWWEAPAVDKGAIASLLVGVYEAAVQRQLVHSLGLTPGDIAPWQSLLQKAGLEPSAIDGIELLAKRPSLMGELTAGDRVSHGKYGQGVVHSVLPHATQAGEVVTVDFSGVGRKRVLITATICTLQRVETASQPFASIT